MLNLLLQALVPLPMTSVQEAAWPEAAGSEAAPPQGGASDTLRTTVQGSGPVLSCDLAVCQVCCSLAAAMSHASPSAEQSDLRNLRQHSLACSSWHQRLPASCTRTVFQQVAREPLGGMQDGTVALDVQPHLREKASRLPDASSGTTEQAAALPPGSPSASASSESDPFAWMASDRASCREPCLRQQPARRQGAALPDLPLDRRRDRRPAALQGGHLWSRGCAVASWLLACPWLLLSRY